MSTTITVRDIDPSDKAWLQQEAKRSGMSMEAFVRRLIEEKRKEHQQVETPSAVFDALFGAEHGVDLPEPTAVGYQPVRFVEDPPDNANR